MNASNYPSLRNAYAGLEPDWEEGAVQVAVDAEPGSYAFPPPPSNPYAARPRRRTSKRRRDGSISIARNPECSPHNPTPTARDQSASQHPTQQRPSLFSAAAKRPPPAQHSKKPGGALKTLIITLARSFGLSETWLALLDAVIDPLLEALAPHTHAIFAAVNPLASNIH